MEFIFLNMSFNPKIKITSFGNVVITLFILYIVKYFFTFNKQMSIIFIKAKCLDINNEQRSYMQLKNVKMYIAMT